MLLVFFSNFFLILSLIFFFSIALYEYNSIIIKIFKQDNLINTLKILLSRSLFLIYLIIFTYIFYRYFSLGYPDNIIYVYILLICIFTDIGGLVFGKTFGGKKLTKISPNKTVIGLIGSFILSLFPYIVFSLIFDNFILFNNNILGNIFLCLYLSLFCQIGDLFISYFKRLAKVKDTGKILPGHGGILDRIDGIIFAIPSVSIFTILF
jgi:phosphatidate cytidylyltransferase